MIIIFFVISFLLFLLWIKVIPVTGKHMAQILHSHLLLFYFKLDEYVVGQYHSDSKEDTLINAL